MDSFTQRMVERAKLRREKLDFHFANNKENNQENILPDPCCIGNENAKDVPENDAMTGLQAHSNIRKLKLQNLALRYSDKTKPIESNELEQEKNTTKISPKKQKCKFGRLAELATKINQWEDDLKQSRYFVPVNNKNQCKEEASKENEKPTIWNPLVDKLCSQGFSVSENQSKLTYDFQNIRQNGKNLSSKKGYEETGGEILTPSSSDLYGKKLICEEERKTRFKCKNISTQIANEKDKQQIKDPAELTLAERKALFERNSETSTQPKNGRNVSKLADCHGKTGKSTFMEANNCQKTLCITEKQNLVCDTPMLNSDVLENQSDCKITKPENCSLKAEYVEEKNISKSPAPVPDIVNPEVSAVSNGAASVLDNAEKDDSSHVRLYPNLSDLDLTDTSELTNSEIEISNESKNGNLCLNMSLTDLLEMNKNNPITPPSDLSFSKSKECEVLNKMDKLLESALNDLPSETEDELEENFPSPPKIVKSSSFEYKSNSSNDQPLLHTVSFYRKQQQHYLPPEDTENQPDPVEDQSNLVENKIQMLLAEVSKQQTIISQASQALNLCLSTVEFSGSGEQVEGERLLLLASHKRQACLNEIQRLKIENSLQPQGENLHSEKGDITLTNITIQLKRDALRAMASAESLQYFVCLIKSDERVLGTPVVSATRENLKDSNLQFPGSVKLEALHSNFRVTIEVYSLELIKKLLPHEQKYHIPSKKEKKLLTPIKTKKSDSKLIKPHIQSPAGPNAVRTSNFQMCGYIVFSLKEITRSQWMLNKVPFVTALEGSLCMTIQSQLRLDDEFRGFLTMFDDISGLGAWHRRWCLLSSHIISFWKYPDDEQKKVPIGTIDLRSVVTENVSLVSHDICARLHTFLLETTRPKLSEDKNSLVLKVQDDVTTIRHLLSADSKQEMLTWCKKLNAILALLRGWKCNFDG